MTFDELWAEIEKLKILPSEAIAQIPHILSKDTKRRMAERTPLEMAQMLDSVIDEINHGSIEGVDDLMKKRL